jgi:undecaprenyl diphosphate synthase
MHSATGNHELGDGVRSHYDVLSFMDVPFGIDLVIRTGKEQRMSDCLLYQTAYSEFVFLKKYFPEIDEKDLERCLQEYESRERRYGR